MFTHDKHTVHACLGRVKQVTYHVTLNLNMIIFLTLYFVQHMDYFYEIIISFIDFSKNTKKGRITQNSHIIILIEF